MLLTCPRSTCKPHSVQRMDSAWAIIYLCGPPGTGAPLKKGRHIGRRATSRCQMAASSLLGLAPGGGYLAACIAADAGGLLHHLFTLALAGGLFSVALFRQVVNAHFPPRVSPAPCSAECGLSSVSLDETAIARLTWGINIIPVLKLLVNRVFAGKSPRKESFPGVVNSSTAASGASALLGALQIASYLLQPGKGLRQTLPVQYSPKRSNTIKTTNTLGKSHSANGR